MAIRAKDRLDTKRAGLSAEAADLVPARQNRIREFRRAAGLTLRELAQSTGTSIQQVSRLERDERRFNGKWLTRAAAALGVEVKDLVPGWNPVAGWALEHGRTLAKPHRSPAKSTETGPTADEPALSGPEKLLITRFRGMSPKSRRALIAVADALSPRNRGGSHPAREQ